MGCAELFLLCSARDSWWPNATKRSSRKIDEVIGKPPDEQRRIVETVKKIYALPHEAISLGDTREGKLNPPDDQ